MWLNWPVFRRRRYRGPLPLGAEVRQQVLEAAEQLGYRPNAIARSLIKNSTRIIGIVIVGFANPFY